MGKIRVSKAPRVFWEKWEEQILLQHVLTQRHRFEKPTAQIFYRKVAEKEKVLAGFSWVAMRDKMRNVKAKYKRAIDWRNKARTTIIGGPDEEPTVRENILKFCYHFDLLDEIFGEKFSFNPMDSQPGEFPSEIVLASLADVSPEANTPTQPVEDKAPSKLFNSTGIKDEIDADSLDVPQSDGATYFERMTEGPQVEKKTESSSIGHLTQIVREMLDHLNDKSLKETERENERVNFEREKFQWEQLHQDRRLELEERKLAEEVRLKEEEIKNKFQLEKYRIEQEMELKKLELELKK